MIGKSIAISLIVFFCFCQALVSKAAYEPFKIDAIKVTNTLAINVNAAGINQFANLNTTPVINTSSNVFTSVDADGVNCAPGTYLVDVILYRTQTPFDNNTRSNVGVEVTVDGVSTGIRAADGYIRANVTSTLGHDEASTTASDLVTLNAAGKIGFTVQRMADNRVNPAPAGFSMMRIARMKD